LIAELSFIKWKTLTQLTWRL